MRALLVLAWCGVALAQQREIGIVAGGALSTNPALGGASSITAGFATGPAAGVLIGHDLYTRWSGEIRYLFGLQQARIRSGGTTAAFSAQAHALSYAVVFHTRPRESHVRPYLSAGAGVKIYRGTGAEAAYRPLMQYAYLTETNELKPMLAVACGIKFLLGERLLGRIDLRDQITPFPRKVITPAPGMSLDGWLHDFVPSIGLSWMF